MLRLRATFIAAFTLLWAAMAFAAPHFPALTGRVVDQAGILTPDQVTMLDNKLATYEQQSGHQIAIATVSSLEGYDIRDYGYQLGRAWGLGQKGKDDGVLVLVAPNEHKTSIEVGYGLEGDLTDATSSVIINQAMLPKFRAGNYLGGLWDGTDDIIKVVGGNGGDIVQAAKQKQAQGQGGGLIALIPFIFFFLFVMIIIMNASRGGVVFLPMGTGRSNGGGYSGGFGGGGFGGGGGFSGGGGSFGGGGASGGW